MTTTHDQIDEPPAELRYHRGLRLGSSLKELVRARELVRTLAERELRARYKQSFLGFAWALITPLTLMVVFSLVFQRLGDIDTDGAPYPLFAYLGLLPWTFFSNSVSLGGQTLIVNESVLKKIYCPREVFPMASVVVAFSDAAVATLALCLLFIIYRTLPEPTTVWVPIILTVQVAFTLGVTLLVSVAIVYLRDLRHLLPIVLTLGLFATPVAYSIEMIPVSMQGLYVALNPLAAVIDSYRRTVLGGVPPDLQLLGIGAAAAAVWLFVGYVVFKRLETGLADVV